MFLQEIPKNTLVHRVRLGWDCFFGLSLLSSLGQVDLCSCLLRKSHAAALVPGLMSMSSAGLPQHEASEEFFLHAVFISSLAPEAVTD